MDDKYVYAELIEKGIAFLHSDNRLAALSCFDKAFLQGKSPLLLSYFSYCIATERGQINEAFTLCREALAIEPDNPVHYLNLGRIFLHAGKTDEALAALRQGLSYGDNRLIMELLQKIGTRNKPVFPFLSRNNRLNKYAGLLLRRLSLR